MPESNEAVVTVLTLARDARVAQQRQAEERIGELQVQVEDLGEEIAVLERLLAEYRHGEVKEAKFGPADAVRHLLRKEPAGIVRSDLLNRAARITTTAPKKAKKTIDQTIRNLANRGEIVEVEGVFRLKQESQNGQPQGD